MAKRVDLVPLTREHYNIAAPESSVCDCATVLACQRRHAECSYCSSRAVPPKPLGNRIQVGGKPIDFGDARIALLTVAAESSPTKPRHRRFIAGVAALNEVNEMAPFARGARAR